MENNEMVMNEVVANFGDWAARCAANRLTGEKRAAAVKAAIKEEEAAEKAKRAAKKAKRAAKKAEKSAIKAAKKGLGAVAGSDRPMTVSEVAAKWTEIFKTVKAAETVDQDAVKSELEEHLRAFFKDKAAHVPDYLHDVMVRQTLKLVWNDFIREYTMMSPERRADFIGNFCEGMAEGYNASIAASSAPQPAESTDSKVDVKLTEVDGVANVDVVIDHTLTPAEVDARAVKGEGQGDGAVIPTTTLAAAFKEAGVL